MQAEINFGEGGRGVKECPSCPADAQGGALSHTASRQTLMPHISAKRTSVAFTRPATTRRIRWNTSEPSAGSFLQQALRVAPSICKAVVCSRARTWNRVS